MDDRLLEFLIAQGVVGDALCRLSPDDFSSLSPALLAADWMEESLQSYYRELYRLQSLALANDPERVELRGMLQRIGRGMS